MDGLKGFAWLLVFQSLGEVISRGLHLPFPGPVVGLMLLFAALHWPRIQQPVQACADFLLAHLSLLFVPVGVGVMAHLGLVGEHGLAIVGVLVMSTLIGMAVSAWVLYRLTGEDDGPDASAEDGAP